MTKTELNNLINQILEIIAQNSDKIPNAPSLTAAACEVRDSPLSDKAINKLGALLVRVINAAKTNDKIRKI